MAQKSGLQGFQMFFFMAFLMVALMTYGGMLIVLMKESLAVGLASVPIFIFTVYGVYRYIGRPSKGPLQELKILVSLPAGVDVKAAALILNRVDAQLLAYLLKKCTVTGDHGKTLLYYKRHGEIYDPQKGCFEIDGATYRPEKLKVLYCR